MAYNNILCLLTTTSLAMLNLLSVGGREFKHRPGGGGGCRRCSRMSPARQRKHFLRIKRCNLTKNLDYCGILSPWGNDALPATCASLNEVASRIDNCRFGYYYY